MSIVEYENYTSEIIQLIVTNYFLIKKDLSQKILIIFLQTFSSILLNLYSIYLFQ